MASDRPPSPLHWVAPGTEGQRGQRNERLYSHPSAALPLWEVSQPLGSPPLPSSSLSFTTGCCMPHSHAGCLDPSLPLLPTPPAPLCPGLSPLPAAAPSPATCPFWLLPWISPFSPPPSGWPPGDRAQGDPFPCLDLTTSIPALDPSVSRAEENFPGDLAAGSQHSPTTILFLLSLLAPKPGKTKSQGTKLKGSLQAVLSRGRVVSSYLPRLRDRFMGCK